MYLDSNKVICLKFGFYIRVVKFFIVLGKLVVFLRSDKRYLGEEESNVKEFVNSLGEKG